MRWDMMTDMRRNALRLLPYGGNQNGGGQSTRSGARVSVS